MKMALYDNFKININYNFLTQFTYIMWHISKWNRIFNKRKKKVWHNFHW